MACLAALTIVLAGFQLQQKGIQACGHSLQKPRGNGVNRQVIVETWIICCKVLLTRGSLEDHVNRGERGGRKTNRAKGSLHLL